MAKLSDAKFLTYIDGEADPGLIAEIESSEVNRTRAAALAKFQNRLSAKLYRLQCPDSLELGEYHLGQVPGPRAKAISAHTQTCPHCTGELALFQAYIEPDPTLLEQVKVLVGRLVSGPGQTSLAPAFNLRGEGDEPLIYEADGIQIAIDIQDDGEHLGQKILLGLITGTDAHAFKAALLHEGRPLAEQEVDELGNFEIADLASSEYELIIKGPEVEIQIQTFKI